MQAAPSCCLWRSCRLSDDGMIHVFLDNAKYHHSQARERMAGSAGGRIKLHFIPTYCPHFNPIERLWGLMHSNITHNKTYATCAQFADATLDFLREKVPRNWARLLISVPNRLFFNDQSKGFSGCDVNRVYILA